VPRKHKEPAPPKDPANPSPTYGQHYPAQALRKEEIQAILRALRGVTPVEVRNRALVVTLWRAGLRISEALALRPTDFDAERNELRVLRGKGGKSRTVAVDVQCSERISQWLSVRRQRWPAVRANATIFCTRTGEPMRASYARDFLHQAAREAGIDRRVHPHAFRHSFTVELVREGVPMPMIQRLLGHSNLATTSTYVSSLSPEEAMAYVKRREW
jgi:site-specific recombinase XerD